MPITERFELRVSVEIIRRLDEWRRSQEDLPSRGEAIRRFVEQGSRRAEQTEKNMIKHLIVGAMLIAAPIQAYAEELQQHPTRTIIHVAPPRVISAVEMQQEQIDQNAARRQEREASTAQTDPTRNALIRAAPLAGVSSEAMRSGLDHLQSMLNQAAKEEDQQQYQKVTIDALIRSLPGNADRTGAPLVGRKFDVVGTVIIATNPKFAHRMTGSNPWFSIILNLDGLSNNERAEVLDQCSPTPCNARLLVTVLKISNDLAVGEVRVDGYR